MYTRIVFVSVILSFFLSFEAITIKYLNVKHVPFEQIVILVEVFKLVVSLCFYYCNCNFKTINIESESKSLISIESQCGESDLESESDLETITYWNWGNIYYYIFNIESESKSLISIESQCGESEISESDLETQSVITYWNWGNIYYYILPAAVYTISNNMTYFALNEMTPAMYNLLMNLKIPFTGILAYLCLNYRMTGVFIISYIVLSTSTIFASLNFHGGITLDISLLGLFYMLVYTSCSASGAILMEWLTQIKFKYTSVYIQNVKFSIMNIFCNLVVIFIRFEVPFTRMNLEHLVVIVVSGIYGLITAVVIKYGGSILKTYSVSVSVFISALFSYLIWGVYYTWNFYVGSVLCMYAVYLYSKEYNNIRSEHSISDILDLSDEQS